MPDVEFFLARLPPFLLSRRTRSLGGSSVTKSDANLILTPLCATRRWTRKGVLSYAARDNPLAANVNELSRASASRSTNIPRFLVPSRILHPGLQPSWMRALFRSLSFPISSSCASRIRRGYSRRIQQLETPFPDVAIPRSANFRFLRMQRITCRDASSGIKSSGSVRLRRRNKNPLIPPRAFSREWRQLGSCSLSPSLSLSPSSNFRQRFSSLLSPAGKRREREKPPSNGRHKEAGCSPSDGVLLTEITLQRATYVA